MVGTERWNIFGFGNLLNDIIDIIHLEGGKVGAVVNNITPTEKQMDNLRRRLGLVEYHVPIVELKEFKPLKDDKNCYGFLNGRDGLINSLRSYELDFPPLIHQDAYLGSNCNVGEGVIIGAGSVIAPNCQLGNFNFINRGLSIGHDTVLEEYVTLSPGVSVAGRVKIGCKTTLGIGSTVIDGVNIGRNSLVGAGAVVVKDVPDNVVVVGVPAKIIKERD